MVGTAVKKVTLGLEEDLEAASPLVVMPLPLVVSDEGRYGAARRFQTASALKGNMHSMDDPASRGVRMALTTPWMWWRGRRWRR
jgi:hypothetical protein